MEKTMPQGNNSLKETVYLMINSLLVMQLERLLILKKEIYHIKNVLNFFLGKYQGIEKIPVKENIRYIQNDIKHIEEKIVFLKNQINKIINDKNKKTKVIFLITFDYTKREIEDLLIVVDSIYNKMRQMFNETLNQYIPYPSLGRRYSNNSLVMYLEYIYREIFFELIDDDKDDNKRLIFDWDYKTEFYYRKFYSPDINPEQKGKYNYYIDLPYSYYELYYLLPSLSYQVVQIILHNELNKNFNKEKKKLFKKLKKDIIAKSNLAGQVYDLFGHDVYLDSLVEDVLSDFYAYFIQKESYIYVFTHQTLGDGLAKDFFQPKDDSFYILPNPWKFSPKKDHNILRLHLLIDVYFFDKKRNEKEKTKILAIKNLLESLIRFDENYKDNTLNHDNDSFEEIYKTNYSNFYDSYKATKVYLEILYHFFKKNLKHIYNKNYVEVLKNNNANIFNTCWEKRFEKLRDDFETALHPSNFRRKLHENSFCDDFVISNQFYTLRLVKIRKDVDLLENQLKRLEKLPFYDSTQTRVYDSYGIYDFISISNVKGFKKITDEFKKYDVDLVDDLAFFETKHILFKIEKKFLDKQVAKSSNSSGDFCGLFILELKKDSNSINGYKDLKNSIKEIFKKLEQNIKLKSEKFEVYKSLGPKDLIVFVKDQTIKQIHDIANIFIDYEYIHRTFTLILSDRGKKPIISKNEKINIVSYLRLKSGKNIDKSIIKQIDSNYQKEHCDKNSSKVFSVTGAIDKKIVWMDGVTIEDVRNFYKKIQSSITDYYTKFELIE